MIKKLALLLGLTVGAVCAKAYSADLGAGMISFPATFPNSEYAISHATLNFSSSTVSPQTISAVSGYRAAYIQIEPTYAQMSAGTSVFFSLTGSTTGIYTSGYLIKMTTESTTLQQKVFEESFETNGSIIMMTAPGVGSVSGRYTQYRRNY